MPVAALNQLAFIIPVRIDSADRMWNLETILRFIIGKFEGAEIVIVEQDSASRLDVLSGKFAMVRHIFIRDGGSFRKAECVNCAIQSVTQRFICTYDADILINPIAISRGLAALMFDGWRLVIPYNRICLDISGSLRMRLGNTLNVLGLDGVTGMGQMVGEPDITVRFVEGGIFMADRETFLAEGGLNRKMASYGWEDTEMYKRFTKLGYPILHLPSFNLIHLEHNRGTDSKPNEHFDSNRLEFLKIKRMSSDVLSRYVETELSISSLGQPKHLAKLRAAQRRANRLKVLRAKALWTRFIVHLQAYGPWATAGKLWSGRGTTR